MLFLRLWNYIRGYVIILVEGYFYEKFLNICTHRQIFLRDIQRRRDLALIMKISIPGFKALRPVARKSGCKVRILKKKGIPFMIKKYRRRKAFFFGAAVCFVLFFILTSFVWDVEVTVQGNRNTQANTVYRKLDDMGIRPGTLKFGIDTGKAANELLLQISDLAWASVTVKGTRVKVHIAERKIPPEVVPLDEPCHIVARRDGIISNIEARDGLKLIKVGNTVTKGEILISGAIPIKNEDGRTRLVHAMGSVKARTWYEGSAPVVTEIKESIRTGKIKDNFSLIVFGKRINFFHQAPDFESYEKVEIPKSLSLGNDIVLPIEWIVERYYENTITARSIDVDEARKTAYEKALADVTDDIPEDAAIRNVSMVYKETPEGGLMVVVTLECTEEIGLEQKIGGN